MRDDMMTAGHATIDVSQRQGPSPDLVHAPLHLHEEGMIHVYEDDDLLLAEPPRLPRGDGLHIGQRVILGMEGVKVGIVVICDNAPSLLLRRLAHHRPEKIVEEDNPHLDRFHVVLPRHPDQGDTDRDIVADHPHGLDLDRWIGLMDGEAEQSERELHLPMKMIDMTHELMFARTDITMLGVQVQAEMFIDEVTVVL